MKNKIKYFIIFLLILLPLLFASKIEAKWWRQSEQKETQKELREEIKQEVKDQLQQLKEKLPFLLPAGVNRAKITSIGGTTLPTQINIIKESKNITLKITEKTLILRKFGGKASLSELRAGDIVSARGTWENSEKAVLNTRVLRDLSIGKRHGTIWGKVKSIDVTAKTFVLETATKGEQKVMVADSAKMVDRRQRAITLADLTVGHRVRVTGLWDLASKQITEVRLIKDWSIGPKATPSPSP